MEESTKKGMKDSTKEIIKGTISVSLIMIPAITFGSLGMTVQMTISLFAGFSSAVLINIDRFEYFKAGQLEAKIREADKVIEEANATITQLKEVAEPLLNTNLASLAYDGYFDGMDVDDKVKVFTELHEVESKLELNSDTTNELMQKTKKAIAYHLFRDIGITINMDGLSRETFFFTKYSIEHDKAFATVEEIEDYISNQPELKNEKVEEAFNKFKEFINEYY